jgi:hypothetical protein
VCALQLFYLNLCVGHDGNTKGKKTPWELFISLVKQLGLSVSALSMIVKNCHVIRKMQISVRSLAS